ncbi:hypothetical protein [Jiella sp. M17.18]|uniref:hypothetical protein n=1 Tax=Jiella sp. M17.18 TaxID=3234247 RepID=UPI0034DF286C
MIRHMALATAATAAAALALVPAAFAQARHHRHAPIPENGRLVRVDSGTPISPAVHTNLPGVDFSGYGGPARGPGGLQNNVGAVGVALPSTSSSNPVPIEQPGITTLGGVPVGAGSPE